MSCARRPSCGRGGSPCPVLGTRSSASCQLPHRVPMPSMPLGPARTPSWTAAVLDVARAWRSRSAACLARTAGAPPPGSWHRGHLRTAGCPSARAGPWRSVRRSRSAQSQPITGRTTDARADQGPEAGEGHTDEDDGQGAEGDQERGAEGAGALVRLLGDHGPELEDQQPHHQPGQEQHTAQHQLLRPTASCPCSRWMRFAARQCSTTTCGSVPKDWMRGLRPAPSMRSRTARPKASPRLGLRSWPTCC